MAKDYYEIEAPAGMNGEEEKEDVATEQPANGEPEESEDQADEEESFEGEDEDVAEAEPEASATVPLSFAGNTKPEPGSFLRLRVVSVGEDGIEVEPVPEGKPDWDREIEALDKKG